MAYYGWSSGTELYHYGIPGQKWGQRRYQNPDGSLTEEGRARYGRIANRHYAAGRALSGYAKKHSGTRLGNLASKAAKRQVAIGNSYRSSKSQNKRDRRIQTALKVGAAAAGAAALGYGAYRLGKNLQNKRIADGSAFAKTVIGKGGKAKTSVSGYGGNVVKIGAKEASAATRKRNMKEGLQSLHNRASDVSANIGARLSTTKATRKRIRQENREILGNKVKSAVGKAKSNAVGAYRKYTPMKTQAKLNNAVYNTKAYGKQYLNAAKRGASVIGRGIGRAAQATSFNVRNAFSRRRRRK